MPLHSPPPSVPAGLLQFWDCCGEEAEDAPGCERGFHVTWDDELNERMGWTKRYGS